MKTIITIENNPIGGSKVTVQVDDNQPINVQESVSQSVSQSPDPLIIKEIRGRGSNVSMSRESDKKVGENKVKTCDFCGDDIGSLPGRNRKACLKPGCVRAQKKQYMDRWLAKQPKKQSRGKNSPVVITKPRQETAGQSMTPQFLPGYEKTSEEIEALRPKAFNLPEKIPTHGSMSARKVSGFTDPWNCEACRRRDHLCPLHQSMTDDGSEPPKIKGNGK